MFDDIEVLGETFSRVIESVRYVYMGVMNIPVLLKIDFISLFVVNNGRDFEK